MEFDVNTFMEATTEQVLDTKRIVIPEGDYRAQITKMDPRADLIKKGERTGETWAGIKVSYELEVDPAVKELTGREKIIVSDMVMLDIIQGTQTVTLDYGKGKNIQLGQLYEACGLNIPNVAKNPMMCQGRMVMVNVRHDVDEKDATKKYERVAGVRKG